jgi:uncharacterized membrane protein
METRWEARIPAQPPHQRVAGRATSGAENAGVVTFHRLGENQTRVNVQMDVEPEGPVETVGTAVGAPERRVKDDLDRFKKFIEARGQETGAWRGSVDQTPT